MNSPRILIADDTPASLSLLASVLEPQGYEVLTATNGRDALQLAARSFPDLVMLDVMMPGHDGFYVCRELKASPETREVPVIFITSRPTGSLTGTDRGSRQPRRHPSQDQPADARTPTTQLRAGIRNRPPPRS